MVPEEVAHRRDSLERGDNSEKKVREEVAERRGASKRSWLRKEIAH